jgi:hypothetical protein
MSRHVLLVRFVEGLVEFNGHAAEWHPERDEVLVDEAKRASPDLPRLVWHESRHVAWDHEGRSPLRHVVLDAASWLGLDRAAFVVLGRPSVEWVDASDAAALKRKLNELYGLAPSADGVGA